MQKISDFELDELDLSILRTLQGKRPYQQC